MPRRITNPLTSGLPAKILFLSYIQPQTGYSLGKKIYNVEKHPPTSKIYSWTKRLIKKDKQEQGYLEKIEGGGGYRTRPDKIVEAIEGILGEKDLALSSMEKRQVTKLLDSEKFRRAIGLFSPIGTSFEGELNVVTIICNFLVQTAVPIMYRRSRGQGRGDISESEFDRLVGCEDVELPENLFSSALYDENFHHFFQGIPIEAPTKTRLDEAQEFAQNLGNAFVLLESLPSSLLAKFKRLDDGLSNMLYIYCFSMMNEG